MSVDLRPIHRALTALKYTTPLDRGDARYVPRADGLGEQILNRIMVPSTRRLLVGGPAGCGKSTEILNLYNLAYKNYTVFVCPCDRDLDLYRFDQITLVRYLLWRLLFVAEQKPLSESFTLTTEIRRDALKCIGTQNPLLKSPRMFFGGPESTTPAGLDTAMLFDTFSRLALEIERGFLPVLLLVDGLEKLPPKSLQDSLGGFIRSPILDVCQSVIVVPLWRLYGWESISTYVDVEVLRIPVQPDPHFVHRVIEVRVGDVFSLPALDAVGEFSGGLVRDGLQIASYACRRALDERTSAQVEKAQVLYAATEIGNAFERMVSDDPARAATFLKAIVKDGQLPGDPSLRDLMLGNGIVLPNEDGTFRVHPCYAWVGGSRDA